MQELEFVTLTGLIRILQEYKKLYGGHIPILLSDSNSTNLLTGLGSVVTMDMVDLLMEIHSELCCSPTVVKIKF